MRLVSGLANQGKVNRSLWAQYQGKEMRRSILEWSIRQYLNSTHLVSIRARKERAEHSSSIKRVKSPSGVKSY